MDLLLWIEGLPPVAALKRSFVAYPLVNATHILSIGVLITTVALMDLRLLGFLREFDTKDFVRRLHGFALAGFAGAAATGLAMFAIRASEYVANAAFLLKLVVILAAGLNMLLLRRQLASSASAYSDPDATVRAQAALSLLLWLGVLICGRFIGFL